MTRTATYTYTRYLLLISTLFLTAAASAQLAQVFSFSCQKANNPATCSQGEGPGAIMQASDGRFYGTAIGGGVQVAALIFSVSGGQYRRVTSFSTSSNSVPNSNLVEAPDGSLWGGASGQGDNPANIGFIYKVNKDGTGFQIVHGITPTFATSFLFHQSLTLGKDGNIYGSSVGAGVQGPNHCPYGCGTIFRINPATLTFTTLRNLNGASDGSGPSALAQASDGNFYGVAANKIFRLTPRGRYQIVTTLPVPAFSNSATGFVGVVQGTNGRLFGMVQGSNIEPQLFQVALDGTGFELFAEIGALQFSSEQSNLLSAADGTIWFTSYSTGIGTKGSVVQLSSVDGTLLQKIAFTGTNGSNPIAPLIRAKDGKLYGTATFGGVVSSGTASGVIFRVGP